MAYTKLHQSILTSTVWLESDATRIVWITLLALADKNGEISGTAPGIAHTARVTLDQCRQALITFLGPDPDSRTPDEDGRRLEEIAGGWQILNYEKYRLMASKDDQRGKTAERTRRWRERKAANSVTQKPSQKGPRDAPVTHDRDIAEAEADRGYESRTDQTIDSPLQTSLAKTRAREKTARPTRVTAGEFKGTNGAHAPPSRQQLIADDWKPSSKAQADLQKALPWMTPRIAELRMIEFRGWVAGKPQFNPDACWLGFMIKTRRDQYADNDGGFNG